MAKEGTVLVAILLAFSNLHGVFSFVHTPHIRDVASVAKIAPMSNFNFRRSVSNPPTRSLGKRQRKTQMMLDLSGISENFVALAQALTDGGGPELGDSIADIIDDLEAIPGTGVTEALEVEQSVQGSTRNSFVTFIFKNPLLKALLGTQAGWGLVLVFSLIVIGQGFETLKETISKNLPNRSIIRSLINKSMCQHLTSLTCFEIRIRM